MHMSTRSLVIALSGALVGSALSSMVVFAWAAPSSAAPGGNVSAPINVSSTPQVKNGPLSVSGLSVYGGSLLQASSYLNWGATPGTSGYGIRDNAGTLEFKASAGSWQSLTSFVANYFAPGSSNPVGQIKFADGTVQTTAAGGLTPHASFHSGSGNLAPYNSTVTVSCAANEVVTSAYGGQSYTSDTTAWNSYCPTYGASTCAFISSCIGATSCTYTNGAGGWTNSILHIICTS